MGKRKEPYSCFDTCHKLMEVRAHNFARGRENDKNGRTEQNCLLNEFPM